MIFTRSIVIFTLLAFCHASYYEDLSDTYRLKLYIKKNDVFRLDLMKLMSFYSTSINFSSNNDMIQIPGIPPEDQSHVFFSDLPLRPKIFKTENSHMIYVSKSGHDLIVFRIEDLERIVKIDNSAANFFSKNPDNFIDDLVLDPNSNMIVLYHNKNEYIDHKDNSKEIKYHLYAVNYATNTFLFNLEVQAPYFTNPTVKILSRSDSDYSTDPTRFVYVIFDKQDQDSKFGTNVGFKLVTVHQLGDNNYEIEQEQWIAINDLLFNGKANNLRLLNVMTTSRHAKQLFLYIELYNPDGLSNNYVYYLSFVYSPLAKEVKFIDPKKFIDQPVVEYFMKDSLYVYITEEAGKKSKNSKGELKKRKMQFCNAEINYCKAGDLQPDWKIRRIMLEREHAIIIMTIKNTNVVFINDFEKNILTWYYDNISNSKKLFLSHSAQNNIKRLYIAEFLSTGFKLRDVTLNSMLEVQESDLVDQQAISLKLEDKELLHLDITRWNGELIVDTFDKKPIEILKTSEGKFRTKLGYAGKNLYFRDSEENHKIKYFNKAELQLKIEDTQEIKNQPFYFYQNWIFLNRVYILNSCSADKDTLQITCQESQRGYLNEDIDVTLITKIYEVGDLLVLMAQNSSNIKVFNKTTKKLWHINQTDRYSEGSACTVIATYLVCKYQYPSLKMQTLRLFYFEEDSFKEIPKFEEDLIEIMKPYFSESQDQVPLTEIRINHYGFDTVENNNLSILYSFVFGGYFDNRFLNFRLVYNINRKDSGTKLDFVSENKEFVKHPSMVKNVIMNVLDSQVLFNSFDPKFSMFCYDGDSYYEFEYIDVQELVDMIVLESHNLIAFVYLKRLDQQYYYSIYRITQNAVNQLIRSERINNFDKNYRLSFYLIDSYTIAVIQYNMLVNQLFTSYVYFQNGPIITSNKPEEPVVIDNVAYYPNLIEDKMFNVNRFKFEKDTKIQIGVNQDSGSFEIANYAKFIGNVKDIEISKDTKSKTKLLVQPPLVVNNDEKIASLEQNVSQKDIYVKETPMILIYKIPSNQNVYSVSFKGKKSKTMSIKFDLPENIECYDIENSDLSITCFWTKGVEQMISIRPFENQNMQEDYVIPRKVSSPRIMEDNANYVTFISKDKYNKFMVIIRIDKTEKKMETKYIGKREMNIDDLRIIDFHYSFNIQEDKLTIIMLDGLSNQLLFFHSSYKTFTQYYVLKRMISLNDLDNSIIQLDCSNVEENRYIFNCFLYSPTRIFLTRIQKSDKAATSDFKWDFSLLRSFYNVLYENSMDESFVLWTQSTDKNLFIYEQDEKNNNGNKLVMYDTASPSVQSDAVSSSSKYSQYILELSDMDKVVGIYKEKIKDEYLKIYYVKNNELRCRKYLIDSYKLQVFNMQALDQQSIEIVVNFANNNNYNLKFYFAKQGLPDKMPTQKKSATLITLIVAIIIVSVLILCSLLAIVVLLRERKKDALRANMINDSQNLGNTSTSYM